jgi:hypothetical protein
MSCWFAQYGETAGGACTYAQRMRMCCLSANPSKHRFINPINELYASPLFYDECLFWDVIDILEPIGVEDEITTSMLAALRIQ